MPASIGVNLRVTGHCRQGGRKYMEDFFSVAYQQTEDEKDLEYAFFGIYDGHGGAEAAAFAKEHLMESIVKHRSFWSDDDEEVLRSIKDGFIHTHLAMWKIHDQWPKTALGLPSTAGTTASIAFIRRGKIYIGHVGDSGITLGYQDPGCPEWRAKPLTKDHKPESEAEMSRIEQSGGKVVSKSGVPRVVWNRPRVGHKGPVRRSTPIDEIPFLAVARSLGDLWSYNSALDMFVVSPTPDVAVIPIDTNSFRCLIFGTDGLYNMLSANMAVHIVQQAEKHNEQAALSDSPNKIWINPSKCLVEKALERWSNTKMRADNTSVITLMLDPPGPPRAQVLRSKKNSYSSSGLQIETRYQEKEEPKPETSAPVPEITTPKMETESPQTDISKLTPLSEEIDKSFVPKPRESTAFNTRPESPKTPKNPKHLDDDKSPSKSDSSSDIQINEVSSSCLDDVKVSKKVEKPSSKSVLRKINLRSSTNNNGNAKDIVVEKEVTSTKLARKEDQRNECRVLRERKNTPNDKNPIQKKKFNIRGKLNLGQEKKKLLQNVLFKTKDTNVKLSDRRSFHSQKDKSSTPSRSENSSTSSSKCPQKSVQKESASSTRVLRNSEKPSKTSQTTVVKKLSASPKIVPSLENQKKTEKSKKNVDGREVRKSTLAQKLRIHQDVFKAKLRGRDKSGRKKNKEKLLRFKKTTGRNNR